MQELTAPQETDNQQVSCTSDLYPARNLEQHMCA